MVLNQQEQELVALLRQYQHQPAMQSALVEYMYRWLEGHRPEVLYGIRRNQGLQRVDEALALFRATRPPQRLHSFQFQRRKRRF